MSRTGDLVIDRLNAERENPDDFCPDCGKKGTHGDQCDDCWAKEDKALQRQMEYEEALREADREVRD